MGFSAVIGGIKRLPICQSIIKWFFGKCECRQIWIPRPGPGLLSLEKWGCC